MAENDPSQNRRNRLSSAQQRAVVVMVALSTFMLADTLYLLTNCIAYALRLQYFAVTMVTAMGISCSSTARVGQITKAAVRRRAFFTPTMETQRSPTLPGKLASRSRSTAWVSVLQITTLMATPMCT